MKFLCLSIYIFFNWQNLKKIQEMEKSDESNTDLEELKNADWVRQLDILFVLFSFEEVVNVFYMLLVKDCSMN